MASGKWRPMLPNTNTNTNTSSDEVVGMMEVLFPGHMYYIKLISKLLLFLFFVAIPQTFFSFPSAPK